MATDELPRFEANVVACSPVIFVTFDAGAGAIQQRTPHCSAGNATN